jgi:hypothetical protein
MELFGEKMTPKPFNDFDVKTVEPDFHRRLFLTFIGTKKDASTPHF